MTDELASASSNIIPDYLFRFIRPSWLDTPGMWFDLRDGEPPEPSVSLYIGSGPTRLERVCEAVAHGPRSFQLKPSGQAAELNTKITLNRINLRKKTLDFVDARHPHYGLVYLTQDEREILQAKSILTVMAKAGLTPYTHCQAFLQSRKKLAAR